MRATHAERVPGARAALLAALLAAVWLLGPGPARAQPPEGPAESSAPAPVPAPPSLPDDADLLLEDLADLEDDWLEEEERDPLEGGNRVVFGMNERIYGWLLDPVADAYQWALPGPVRRSVRRFFANLEEPAVLVNDVLQGRGRRAGTTGLRFAINTTLGVGGLFDPADAWGMQAHHSDFGETLAVYGVAEGPYLVLPVLGPSSARDAFGVIVDGLFRPDTWLLAAAPLTLVVTGDGLSEYEARRFQLEELRRNSVDFYAALRSAYRMDRAAQIREARGQLVSEDEELQAIPFPSRRASQGDASVVPASASAILSSTAASSESNPSRLTSDE